MLLLEGQLSQPCARGFHRVWCLRVISCRSHSSIGASCSTDSPSVGVVPWAVSPGTTPVARRLSVLRAYQAEYTSTCFDLIALLLMKTPGDAAMLPPKREGDRSVTQSQNDLVRSGLY
jgi:hypothetical protein